MAKPLPTAPATPIRPTSSHSTRTIDSRPLTASSRASQLSYFSQYSIDELARRVFFRPSQDDESDGTATPKRHMSSISQALIGTPSPTRLMFHPDSDPERETKPLPPSPTRHSSNESAEVKIRLQIPKFGGWSSDMADTTPTQRTPTFRLPPRPPPKRSASIDYPSAAHQSNPNRFEKKRHSVQYGVSTWTSHPSPSLLAPPNLPKSPSSSSRARLPPSTFKSRPVSLPPPANVSPSSRRHIRFPSHSRVMAYFRPNSELEPLEARLSAPPTFSSGRKRSWSFRSARNFNDDPRITGSLQRSASRALPRTPNRLPEWMPNLLIIGVLAPWYWILRQWMTMFPSAQATTDDNALSMAERGVSTFESQGYPPGVRVHTDDDGETRGRECGFFATFSILIRGFRCGTAESTDDARFNSYRNMH